MLPLQSDMSNTLQIIIQHLINFIIFPVKFKPHSTVNGLVRLIASTRYGRKQNRRLKSNVKTLKTEGWRLLRLS